MVHEEIVQGAYHISMGIHALMTNYAIASTPNATMKREGWIRPPVGFVKLNVDDFFNQDLLRGTAGAVLRGAKRNFIAGGNWKIDWCADVLTAEALVLRFSLSLAQRVG